MNSTGSALFAFVLLFVTLAYGVFQGRALIDGPLLTVTSPRAGETITSTLLPVEGSTKHVTHVQINGRPVIMDTVGTFHEELVTPDGYGVILVEARNRFGHQRTRRIEFYGNPQHNS